MITKIESIDGFHVYKPDSISTKTPDFRKLNLIYGFNGSGKSLLTKILGCCCKHLPQSFVGGECFKISHDDGSSITNTNYSSNASDKTFIYSEEFANTELQWSSSKANPLVALGHEQQDTAKKTRWC